MNYLTDEETNKALVKAGKVKTMNEKECEKKLVKQLGSLDVREEIVLKEAYKQGQQDALKKLRKKILELEVNKRNIIKEQKKDGATGYNEIYGDDLQEINIELAILRIVLKESK